MNKVRVPVMKEILNDAEREEIIKRLRDAKVDSVFLCTLWSLDNQKKYERELEELRENIPIFEANGFEVAVWLGSTIGHSAPLAGIDESIGSWVPWTGVSGNVCDGCFCPLDERFSEAIIRWVKDVAETGAKIIILDDDFRMSDRGDSQGCLCDLHLAEFNRLVGENLTREEVVNKVFTGKKNRYRDAYYQMQGDTLKNFAAKMRAAVDEVDETIRLGYCCPPAGFNVDGTNAVELSHIFAGKTKPVLRLGGAPYWGKMDSTMVSFCTETERLIQTWCDGEGIETFSELDSYPRPRFSIPASFMEASDTILMADGRLCGSLKYMADYSASPRYETGYFDAHCKNLWLYDEIQKRFDGKRAVGLNIFEVHNKLRDMDWPEEFCGVNQRLGSQLLPPTSVRWMRNLSLPLTYDNPDSASVVFGENAAYITPEMRKKGMVLNMRSAYILHEQGIDVGYTEMTYAGVPIKERYLDENEIINIMDGVGVYALKHKPGARIVTEFYVDGKAVPGVYEYENADGERYLVFPFWEYNAKEPKTSLSGYVVKPHWLGEDPWYALMRNYCRTRQMIKSIEWLNQKPMDAVCTGYPYLYILTKKDEKSLTVGLWNLSMDEITNPVVILGESYSTLECVNGEATLNEKKVQLHTTIQPLKCVVIELIK